MKISIYQTPKSNPNQPPVLIADTIQEFIELINNEMVNVEDFKFSCKCEVEQ